MVVGMGRKSCEASHIQPTFSLLCTAPDIIAPMESERLNLIENSLQDLAARSAELRRYL
jgi:hypothetical protein